MSKYDKILLSILSGRSDANIPFADLISVLTKLNFQIRIKGSHHILTRTGMNEIINIQPTENNKSKPYQVKQIRNLIYKYKLWEFENE